jgi:hypothetical protein
MADRLAGSKIQRFVSGTGEKSRNNWGMTWSGVGGADIKKGTLASARRELMIWWMKAFYTTKRMASGSAVVANQFAWRGCMAGVLMALCFVLGAAETKPQNGWEILAPIPEPIRTEFELKPFYVKAIVYHGLPIVSSEKSNDAALEEAAWLVDKMLGDRLDIVEAMAKNQVRLAVMAHNEMTIDIPEHSDLKPADYWNRRARGLGATRARPAVSCAEENLLCFPGDPYRQENIMIHEFAHAIHEMGLNTVDPTFDKRLKKIFETAKTKGLWKEKYASVNRMEYWAEAVQSWFDTNRENDADHNHVNTRQELKEYDPEVAELVKSIFGDKPWRYQKPLDRKAEDRAHLRGYDFASSPRFEWPKGLPEKVSRQP